jgi:hypothetical protein
MFATSTYFPLTVLRPSPADSLNTALRPGTLRSPQSFSVNAMSETAGALEKTGDNAPRQPMYRRDSRTYYTWKALSMVSSWRRRKSRKKKRRAARPPPFSENILYGLGRLYILRLPPLGSLHYVELHLLPFLQAAESARLYRREMYKHVFAALSADKPVTLGIVEPLYCSCFHGVALFLFN